jgi:hypothetical protein
MLRDPLMQRAETILRYLQRQGRAEPRLSARPLQKEHEIPRDRERDAAAQILLSCTRASARSIPAVTPADVQTEPSRTKIGSVSTLTAEHAGRDRRRPTCG